MAALGRTASLDAWRFFLVCIGALLDVARCCFSNNALNDGAILYEGVGKERGGSK